MKKESVVLLAEVLFAGKGCPVCGGHKTEKARTCRVCFEEIGLDATLAVDEVIATCQEAAEGNAAAAKGEIKRQVVFGPILAQVKIDFDAIFYSRSRNNIWSIQPYWDCSKSVPGGFVSVYVFGAEKARPGEGVTALIDLKHRESRAGGNVIHYLRTQAVPGIVGSDVKLQLVSLKEGENLIPGLPVEFVEEGKRNYAVGFQYEYVSKEAKRATGQLSELADTLLAPIFKRLTARAG